MSEKILLAGAAGAIGKRLVPLLIEAGHDVFGTTRSAEKAEGLREAGVTPLVIDVFDAAALKKALTAIRPETVIHQLTDLPPGTDPARMAQAVVANARLRREGTRNLVDAAIASGAKRLIAQSIAWAYAPGSPPHGEDDPLDLAAAEPRITSVRGVEALEEAVLTAPLAGIVLRYGQLYGPGTGQNTPKPEASAPLHVDAAASAALLSVRFGKPGIYNIAEAGGLVRIDKAQRDLGFDPAFRLA